MKVSMKNTKKKKNKILTQSPDSDGGQFSVGQKHKRTNKNTKT